MTVASRLFLALMPPEGVCAEIEKAAKALNIKMPHGGRAVPPPKYHMTLVFLGHTLTADDQFDVIQAAQQIVAKPFQMRLEVASCFPDAQAWWLGPRQVPAALTALRADLVAKLKVEDITPERPRFNPHVTVIRSKLRLPLTQITPIEWPVTDFSLIRSNLVPEQSIYEEVGRWQLGKGQMTLL